MAGVRTLAAATPPALVERLASAVGERNVVTAPDLLEPYSHDETPGITCMPEVVVKPGSAEEVSAVVRLAWESGVPVTPRGAGTGLSGGAVPVAGGIVVSTERMKRVIEIDEANMMVVVEPGIIVAELHKAVQEKGLLYPPDPASLDSCSIGGNLAENAGGPAAVKYGVTRDYVAGLKAVLPAGGLISLGGKLVKNVTGYDLIGLLVGSEGTLGVIVEATLRLIPMPQVRLDLLVPFDSLELATRAIGDVMKNRRITPVVLEFMDREGVKTCERHLGRPVPFSDAAAQLIIGLDGNDRGKVDLDAEAISEICLEGGAEDVLVADSPFAKQRLWEARRLLLETLKATSDRVEVLDVVVPRAVIPLMVSRTYELASVIGVPVVAFGHAGDGNVHVNLLKREMDEATWKARVERLIPEIYEASLNLGGTITGEHGVGSCRRAYVGRALGRAELGLMAGIKNLIDPRGLMNPGKIFPPELLAPAPAAAPVAGMGRAGDR